MRDGWILVTGGAGYVGSHVALSLLDHGWPVVVLDNLVTGVRRLVPGDARFVHGDAGDAELLGSLLRRPGCLAVLHFAGSTVVPDSLADPLGYYRNNTAVSRTLIAACVDAGVHAFIFSSTAAVYGNPATLPVAEDAPPRPVSPYGTSKLWTETMLHDAGVATGLRHVALRYFNVAGADPWGRSGQSTPQATHLVKVACEVAAGRRDAITIHGDDYDTPDGT
ncbi:MAG: NAD-dependent epimerase/dehydratase family protein, partial [Ignavibacteriales bacterium]